ncbi:uncharacterized protein LOC126743078 [Anthonomus grandis grandis]|uniref:uncharacterized protein LOC126743078 n=1 Tax=Anthonomus grandis grandis TaxID=2921223 RepID=UPI00216645FD|nr:uncharacterized protein LOC126743078 [Anthonomus grandis grandis]
MVLALKVVVKFLLVFAVARAIHFDNKLTVIKNDCYERLAIGEKLSPQQTYKTFAHNTVSQCEMECTKEHKRCRAYSFGIGPKGNGTCLLGKYIIKETADLKPIGTIKDTDYDLYTKTLDCQIVLEPPEHHEEQPATPPVKIKVSKPAHDGYAVQEQHGDHHIPAQTNHHHNSISQPTGYQYAKPQGQAPGHVGSQGDDLHHVQALVSIASGPENVLHPVHDILVSQDNYPPKPVNGHLPPFRPSALPKPYDDHKLQPANLQFGYGYGSLSYLPNTHMDQNSRPDPEIPSRPSYELNSGYGNGQVQVDRRKYQSHHSSYNSYESENHRYSLEHAEDYNPNYNFYDHYEKPFPNYPNKYGSVIPHPNDYNRPDYDYLFLRPGNDPSRPDWGESGYGRPIKPNYEHKMPHKASGYMPGRPSGDGAMASGFSRPKSSYHDLSADYEHGLGLGFGDRPIKPSEDSIYRPNRPSYHDTHSDREPGYSNNLSRPSEDLVYGHPRPSSHSNHEPGVNFDYGNKPSRPSEDSIYTRPSRPSYQDARPDHKPGYGGDPFSGYKYNVPGYGTQVLEENPTNLSSNSRPTSSGLSNHYGGIDYGNRNYRKPETGNRKVVTSGSDYGGKHVVTGIIKEIKEACFRRSFAGKRVVRSLVQKLLDCDTVEQCQQECADERQFTCEGFNYRLDPTGRGKGECELLDLPLSRLDLSRDIVRDPDYDIYTRDRNAVQVGCRQFPASASFHPGTYGGGHGLYDRFDGGNRRGDGLRPLERPLSAIIPPLRRPTDNWEDGYREDNLRPRPLLPPPPPVDRRPSPPLPRPPYDDTTRQEYGNRRGDYSFHHHSHESHHSSYHYNEHNVDSFDYHGERQRPSGIHYLPGSSFDHAPPKKYPVIVPLDDKYHQSPPIPPLEPAYFEDRYRLHNGYSGQKFWRYGEEYGDRFRHKDLRNYYVPTKPPPKPYIPEDWGAYGGSYGTGGLSLEYQGYGDRKSYNYWGLNKFERDKQSSLYGSDRPGRPLLRPQEPYLPPSRPASNGLGYLPYDSNGFELDNHISPAEPRKPPFPILKDECSLRSATGFRLHKSVVKKLFTVPNIYECELLCVNEKEFFCASYAFRYTIHVGDLAADNCYLSTRNHKELDYYTDLEPDKDFDIYTMNNRVRCQEPMLVLGREESECFWRVRSGQRLDHSVVRDSLTVKSIVDCQLECLRSRRFTCRAYSFRYGSPIIGGIIDNCQLTDWPYFDLDPKSHFVPEPGFEVYDRGSYGHGCEPNHFGIGGKAPVKNDEGVKIDQLCYIGFGSAAKLLPQATIKSLYVPTELDCKVECSKARQGNAFRCMTFSFVTDGPKIGHNCYLSDIMQRDLLPNVDYVDDPTSWLFTWDNHNPECVNLAYKHLHDGVSSKGFENDARDYVNALDVWRVYSVKGWPCKRGTLCKENRVTGFWYCELEGGEHDAWDYCCSPDHHCGFSNGYPYSWCYVGPSRTQWRKCNDQYYPYIHNVLDRFDTDKRPWHTSGYIPPPPHTHGYRPDRPSAPLRPEGPKPSLDEYEQQFDSEFLSPPKPGGFGQPRRWPVSYLHKEMPPNNTQPDAKSSRVESPENSKLSAIKSLIDVIKNTEVENVQYHISNDSKKSDDILYVKIPIPTFDDDTNNSTKQSKGDGKVSFETVESNKEESLRGQKSLRVENQPAFNKYNANTNANQYSQTREYLTKEPERKFPVYRRGFVTRTNLSSSGHIRSL